MKELMNHHVFDEVPGSEAVGKKLIRARWLNDDRGEKARERLVPMIIAAFEGKRDDHHAMTPPLKVARMLISRVATGSKSRRRVLGIHDIQVAFFHAPVVDGHVALLRRALYGGRQASWLWQKAVDRAVKELNLAHLVVVPCTYFHEAWDMALTYHGDDFMSESKPGFAGRGTCSILRREAILGRTGPGYPGRGAIPQEVFVVERPRVRVARRSSEGWSVHCADGNHWMSILSNSWDQSNGPRSARCRSGGGGQCDEVGSAGVRAHHAHQHGPARSAVQTVMSTIAKLLEITKPRLRKTARYLEDKPVLEYVMSTRTRTSAWRSETATRPEIARHADQQQRWKSSETTALRVPLDSRQ